MSQSVRTMPPCHLSIEINHNLLLLRTRQFLSFPIAAFRCNSIVVPITTPSIIILSLLTISSTGLWCESSNSQPLYHFRKVLISNSITPSLTKHPLNIQPHSFYSCVISNSYNQVSKHSTAYKLVRLSAVLYDST